MRVLSIASAFEIVTHGFVVPMAFGIHFTVIRFECRCKIAKQYLNLGLSVECTVVIGGMRSNVSSLGQAVSRVVI
jgi:hypothetical protein